MVQVLNIYKRPYDELHPVICMDESPKQLIKDTRVPIPMKLGHETKADFEYERCGVANIFLESEPLKGMRYVYVTERKTKVNWAEFIKKIPDEWYKDVQKITLVMANLATHKASALYETYYPKEAKRIWDRFEFTYTPKHGSWLDMSEIELNVIMGQCLKRSIDNIKTMKKEACAWQSRAIENQLTRFSFNLSFNFSISSLSFFSTTFA